MQDSAIKHLELYFTSESILNMLEGFYKVKKISLIFPSD